MTWIKVDYLVATEREAIAAEAEKYKASLLSPDPGCQYDQVEIWLLIELVNLFINCLHLFDF